MILSRLMAALTFRTELKYTMLIKVALRGRLQGSRNDKYCRLGLLMFLSIGVNFILFQQVFGA